MKDVKKSLGTFESIHALETFLIEDNEKAYQVKNYRRKLGNGKVRNAYITDRSQTIWLFSRGYGIEYLFSEEEKNRMII